MLFTQHTCKGVGILLFLVFPKVSSCSFVIVVISRGESAAREIENNDCVDVVTTKRVMFTRRSRQYWFPTNHKLCSCNFMIS